MPCPDEAGEGEPSRVDDHPKHGPGQDESARSEPDLAVEAPTRGVERPARLSPCRRAALEHPCSDHLRCQGFGGYRGSAAAFADRDHVPDAGQVGDAARDLFSGQVDRPGIWPVANSDAERTSRRINPWPSLRFFPKDSMQRISMLQRVRFTILGVRRACVGKGGRTREGEGEPMRRLPLPPDAEPTRGAEPGEAPLDHPATFSGPPGGVDSPPGYAVLHAPRAARLAAEGVVAGLVSVELARLAAGPSSLTLDRAHGVEERPDEEAVVSVAGREQARERRVQVVHDQVEFGRARPRSVAEGPTASPPFWRARSSSRARPATSRARPRGRACPGPPGGGEPRRPPPASPAACTSRSCRSRPARAARPAKGGRRATRIGCLEGSPDRPQRDGGPWGSACEGEAKAPPCARANRPHERPSYAFLRLRSRL